MLRIIPPPPPPLFIYWIYVVAHALSTILSKMTGDDGWAESSISEICRLNSHEIVVAISSHENVLVAKEWCTKNIHCQVQLWVFVVLLWFFFNIVCGFILHIFKCYLILFYCYIICPSLLKRAVLSLFVTTLFVHHCQRGPYCHLSVLECFRRWLNRPLWAQKHLLQWGQGYAGWSET